MKICENYGGPEVQNHSTQKYQKSQKLKKKKKKKCKLHLRKQLKFQKLKHNYNRIKMKCFRKQRKKRKRWMLRNITDWIKTFVHHINQKVFGVKRYWMCSELISKLLLICKH